MRVRNVAAATVLAAGLALAPVSAAHASFLCWLHVCGAVRNTQASVHYVAVECADGAWRRVYPDRLSTGKCHDTVKFRVPSTTYWVAQYDTRINAWVRVPPGTWRVNDWQTVDLRVRHR